MLKLLDLERTTVTIDAMGCQMEIAHQIVEQNGHYVLALKKNHATFHEEVTLFIDQAIEKGFTALSHDYHEQTENGHGRIETRRAWSTPEMAWFEDREQWPGLQCFAAVECERMVDDIMTTVRRFFTSSLDGRDG